jgi:Tfp pilus assembly PilM family ATPase
MAVFNSGGTVGLVIEAGSVKAVAVDRVRGEIGPVACVEAKIGTSPDDEDYGEILAGTIRELFEANSLPRDRVIAAVSSSDAVLRRVSLPFDDESRIRKTIRFEVEDALPFPIESCITGYHVGRRGEGRAEVHVAAVAKEGLAAFLGLLERCGLEIIALELDLAAMANAAAWAGLSDRCCLLVDVGSDVTRAVVYDGSVAFWRAFRTESGSVADVAKKLGSELRRSLLSADLQREPELVVLTGSHPGLSQLESALSEALGVEVTALPEQEGRSGEGAAWRDVGTAGFVALGCALKYSGFDVSTMNMRQGEFAYRRKFEQLTPALTVLASLVLACGVLWNVRLAGVWAFAGTQEGLIRENARKLWAEAGVAEDPPDTVDGMLVKIVELIDDAKPDKNAKAARVLSILDEWREWSGLVPQDIDVVFDELNMRQKSLQLTGTVPSLGDAEKLQQALNAGGRFSFALPQTRTGPDGRTIFTLRHEYK